MYEKYHWGRLVKFVNIRTRLELCCGIEVILVLDNSLVRRKLFSFIAKLSFVFIAVGKSLSVEKRSRFLCAMSLVSSTILSRTIRIVDEFPVLLDFQDKEAMFFLSSM